MEIPHTSKTFPDKLETPHNFNYFKFGVLLKLHCYFQKRLMENNFKIFIILKYLQK
jgi:hypothetical protein